MELRNMTVCFVLNKTINFPTNLPNVVHDKHRFNGAIWKNDGLTFLIFSTGKINCVGGKSLEKVRCGISDLLSRLGGGYSVREECVANLVASSKFDFAIDLHKLYKLTSSYYLSSYEPELFAGLIVRMSGLTTIIFHTGKFFMTGAKTQLQMDTALAQLQGLCVQCAKNQ